MAEGWERRAAEWLAWARPPGHDAYWRYRDAFFELLPRPAGGALDVGCGEGRVTRDLSRRSAGQPAETRVVIQWVTK